MRSVRSTVVSATAHAYTFSTFLYRLRLQHTVIHHGLDFSGNYLRVCRPLVAEWIWAEHHSRKPNCTGFQHSLSILTHGPLNLSLSDLRCRVQQQIFHVSPRSTGMPSSHAGRTLVYPVVLSFSSLPDLFVFIN